MDHTGNIVRKASSPKKLIDIHTHILPGMDDGARDKEECARLLDILLSQGIEAVVLSPHFYSHRESLDRFLGRREQALFSLLSIPGITEHFDAKTGQVAVYQPHQHVAGGEVQGSIRIFLAAECALSKTLANYRNLADLCFGEASYLLVEMPFEREWTASTFHEIDKLSSTFEVQPIIVHIERYPATNFGRKLEPIQQLVDYACLIQMNIDAVLERRSRRAGKTLLSGGWIDVLGSDCHNLTNRPPRFDEFRDYAVKKLNLDLDQFSRIDL